MPSDAAFCSRCGLPVAQRTAPPSSAMPGYAAPPPPPKKSNTTVIILIVLGVVFIVGVAVVAILASVLSPIAGRAHSSAQSATCESNVKQISLGLIQYTQDYDEVLPPSAAAYKDVLAPYVKDEAVYHCPADEGEEVTYSLNANLQGVPLANLAHPEAVVAVYEGKDQKLDFRHDGKAVVGFADGRVKTVTKDEAAGLQWKP